MKLLRTRFIHLFFVFFLLCFSNLRAQTVLEKAGEAYQNREWKAVIENYGHLIKESPFNGDFHYRLARAYFMSENYPLSKKHFHHAIEHGVSTNSGYAFYFLARLEARLKNRDKALAYLSNAIDYSPDYIRIAKQEEDFQLFSADTKFQKLLGNYQPNKDSEIEAWREELQFLKNRMERSHYDLFHYTSKSKWDSITSDLYAQIPHLSTIEILTRFSEIGGLAMDSHTYANALFGTSIGYHFNMLPVEFYFFGEKLFIRAAHSNYSDLVGKEVVKVGGKTIEEVYLEFQERPVTGLDNNFQLKWQLPWFLRTPELLFGKKIIKTTQFVTFELKDESGKLSTLKVYPNQKLNPNIMLSTAPEDWVNMRDEAQNPTPVFLKDPHRTFWMEYLKNDKLLFVQINNIRDMEQESMASFSDRFLTAARKNKAKALILDVRMNNGGNAHIARALVKKLLRSEYNQPNKLFIIVGRNTFSATMPPIAALDKWSEAIFVGEPTGTRPNFIAEGNMFQLPYSGMYASVSNNYWQGGFNSNDSRKWIAPELGAAPNVRDYKNNIDPALERIKKYLRSVP